MIGLQYLGKKAPECDDRRINTLPIRYSELLELLLSSLLAEPLRKGDSGAWTACDFHGSKP